MSYSDLIGIPKSLQKNHIDDFDSQMSAALHAGHRLSDALLNDALGEGAHVTTQNCVSNYNHFSLNTGRESVGGGGKSYDTTKEERHNHAMGDMVTQDGLPQDGMQGQSMARYGRMPQNFNGQPMLNAIRQHPGPYAQSGMVMQKQPYNPYPQQGQNPQFTQQQQYNPYPQREEHGIGDLVGGAYRGVRDAAGWVGDRASDAAHWGEGALKTGVHAVSPYIAPVVSGVAGAVGGLGGTLAGGPVGGVAGGISGGIAGGELGNKIGNSLYDWSMPASERRQQQQQQQQQHDMANMLQDYRGYQQQGNQQYAAGDQIRYYHADGDQVYNPPLNEAYADDRPRSMMRHGGRSKNSYK